MTNALDVDEVQLVDLGLAPEDVAVLRGVLRSLPQSSVSDVDTAGPLSPARFTVVALLLGVHSAALSVAGLVRLERLAFERVAVTETFDRGRLFHLVGVRAARVIDPVRAMEAFHRSLDALSSSSEPAAVGYAGRVHNSIANLLLHRGMFADARRSLQNALAVAEATADVASLGFVLGNLARLESSTGNYALAVQIWHRDIRLVEQQDGANHKLLSRLLCSCAEVEIERRELSAAEEVLERARGLLDDDDVEGRCRVLVGLARCALRRGNLSLASERMVAARTLGLRLGPGRTQFELDRAEGERLLAADHADEAAAHFDRAIARLAAAPSTRLDRADLLLGLADCAARGGGTAKEARCVRQALGLLDGTDARGQRKSLEQRLERLSEAELLVHQLQRVVGVDVEQFRWLLERADGDRFSGERREVVVLFSDLRGFTSLAERIDGDVLVDLLSRYLSTMTTAVEHYGGVVDKFIGDAVMAIFGLTSSVGASSSALHSALLMHEEARRLNADIPLDLKRAGLRFEAGIGVHYGDVHVGLIGSASRRSFTVIGDVVNTASRLESMTKKLGARLVATDAVLTRAKREHPDRFASVPLGCFAPAGRQEGLQLHDVVASALELMTVANEERVAADVVDAALRRGDRAAARAPLAQLLAMDTPRLLTWKKLAAALDDPAFDGVVRLTEK
ncbi:MAG: adenylate/guanylate cyclase domain-containing protein [Deltaproteobacteria bacterium]|nr:adenylate/guanylate cyclase domain-containing protein [Deltaproteobacteria bacterium]